MFIFGSGSNILVGDGGVRGLTIENRTSDVDGPSPNGAGFKARVASGVSFAALSRRMANAGYAGIEWACGIPGSLGGAVVSNAGAYEWSLKDVLKGARLSDEDGNVDRGRSRGTGSHLPQQRLHAAAKSATRSCSRLTCDLERGDAAALKQRVREFDEQRRAAQPPGRNCGSVFKNPPQNPSWWYIAQVGLRGHRIGGAQFSDQHANFILNLGDAKAADIVALIELAQQRVRDRFGIELEPEVALVGEFE